MRSDPLAEALLGSTSRTGRLLIRRRVSLPVANPLQFPMINREVAQPLTIPTEPVKPAIRLQLVKTKLTAPRGLSDAQRIELMTPGFLWKYQCDRFAADQPDNADVISQYGAAFMASSIEVLDDLEQAAAERLIHKVGSVAGHVLDPIKGIDDDVRMLAFDLWLTQLLESGYLVLYADTLFAGALMGWNEAILANPANKRRFASLLRPAEHHAKAIMRRFRERGFYVGENAC